MFNNVKFQDLTLKDDYMFSRFLSNYPDMAKELCEVLTNRLLDSFDLIKEEWQISPNIDVKQIRLDTYARSGNYIFDIEMQNYPDKNLFDRADYYANAIKVDSLKPGCPYAKRPTVVVIFICTYNPSPPSNELVYLAKDKLHTCNMTNFSLKDITEETKYDNRCDKIIVNTKGDIPEGCSEKLRALIKYINTGVVTDDFTSRIDKAIEEIKNNEEEVSRFMTLGYRLELEAKRVEEENKDKWKNEGLKESQNTFVNRMYVKGYSIEDIAEVADLSANQVNQILSQKKN